MTRKVTRRELGLLGMSALAATSAKAQDSMGTLVQPDISRLSSDTKETLARILVQQSLRNQISAGVAEGPNPDPEYLEFWAELRPANNEMDYFRQAVDDGLAPESFLSVSPDIIGAGWSEEGYLEFTPDFTDMYPDAQAQGKNSNVMINMRAVEGGEMIRDEFFYQDILNSIRK